MAPSMDVQNIEASFKHVGFGIDSMHNFKDLFGCSLHTSSDLIYILLQVLRAVESRDRHFSHQCKIDDSKKISIYHITADSRIYT